MELPFRHGLLRSWRQADAETLVRHADSRRVWRNLRDRFPHPYTLSDAEEWIRQASQAAPETQLAIEVAGEAIGGIGLELGTDVCRRSAELGFWIGEAFWGRGIVTEAVRSMTQYAFSSFEICRLQAGVFEWNRASMRVLEKAGFSCEGRLRKSVTKDGQTIDLFLYALVKE